MRETQLCVCVHALECAPAHLSLSLANSAFMEDTFFGKYCSGAFGMWVSVSVTVRPLGFGGAVKDRRIIVFVKKQRNKDQETHRQS